MTMMVMVVMMMLITECEEPSAPTGQNTPAEGSSPFHSTQSSTACLLGLWGPASTKRREITSNWQKKEYASIWIPVSGFALYGYGAGAGGLPVLEQLSGRLADNPESSCEHHQSMV
uniref:Uncharacterized protein n=1 Tax=Anopheles coluzzii TaxID=1518534 RepID=A0A8W7PYC3_ANOCL